MPGVGSERFFVAASAVGGEAQEVFDKAISLDPPWEMDGSARIGAAAGRRDRSPAGRTSNGRRDGAQSLSFAQLSWKSLSKPKTFSTRSKGVAIGRKLDENDPTPWLYSAWCFVNNSSQRRH